jgi:hypothetical protein
MSVVSAFFGLDCANSQPVRHHHHSSSVAVGSVSAPHAAAAVPLQRLPREAVTLASSDRKRLTSPTRSHQRVAVRVHAVHTLPWRKCGNTPRGKLDELVSNKTRKARCSVRLHLQHPPPPPKALSSNNSSNDVSFLLLRFTHPCPLFPPSPSRPPSIPLSPPLPPSRPLPSPPFTFHGWKSSPAPPPAPAPPAASAP